MTERVPGVLGTPPRLCEWCGQPIPPGARADAEVCGVVCRKRRWRFRRAAGATRPAAIAPTRPASIEADA